MATLRDIAMACGVSVSTVSKSLNDYKEIPPKTRKKIQAIAQRMGYRGMGRQSRWDRTWLIGALITGDQHTLLHQGLLMEIRRILAKRGYELVILRPQERKGPETFSPGYLARARMLGLEGIFLFSSIDERSLYRTGEYRAVRDLLLGEIPVVVVDTCYGTCRSVIPGYEEGMSGLVHHIHQKGHRRIALVHGETPEPGAPQENEGVWDVPFCKAMSEDGGRVPGHLLQPVKAASAQEAFAATVELLTGMRWILPTCILYTDDTLLAGGMAAAWQCGRKVPEEVSVAAIRYNVHLLGTDPYVTAWHFDLTRIADAAVEKLLAPEEEDEDSARRMLKVSGELCPGRTVREI